MISKSKNPMIKDPCWEKALHGECLATIIHKREGGRKWWM